MPNITDYKILQAGSIEELQAAVEAALSDGFWPFGSMTFTPIYDSNGKLSTWEYAATMCKGSGEAEEVEYTPEDVAKKDATGGYAGLTLFKINFKNAANTFTSFFTNTNTAARTYTFQDRNGTIADNTDLAGKLDVLHTVSDTKATAATFPLDTFATATYRSGVYELQVSRAGKYDIVRVSVVHDGTTASVDATVANNQGGSTGVTFSAAIDTGTLTLNWINADTVSTTVKGVRTVLLAI